LRRALERRVDAGCSDPARLGLSELAPEQPGQLSVDFAGAPSRIGHPDRAHGSGSGLPLSERGRSDAQGRSCPVHPPRAGVLVNRFMPILLPIALSFLPVAVACPADAAPRAATSCAARTTLDLRPPSLESLHLQNP